MSPEIEKLTDDEAVTAMKALVRAWTDAKGAEVLAVWQELEKESRDAGGAAAASSEIEGSAAVARLVLEAVLTGNSSDAAGWAKAAIADAQLARAQVLDPVSLAIVGTTLIGLVLASRVKNISTGEFYEGIPAGLEKIIQAGAKLIGL